MIKTEAIKYAGSKLKLLPYIVQMLQSLDGVQTVLDGFSGSTRVAQAFAQLNYKVHANDLALWSEVLGRCYLIANNDAQYYRDLINHLNNVKPRCGWFSEYYGGEAHEQKKAFSIKNTAKLDAIRDEIDCLCLPENDKCVALTSLILALDKVDNTLGHYAAYLTTWSARSQKDLLLKVPEKFDITQENEVSCGDIFEIIKGRTYDLAYFDPPYGSNNLKMPTSRVRYGAYYHLWTTIIKNDKPQVFGKAARRIDTRDKVSASVFEEYRKSDDGQFLALEALRNLIKQTNARYIMLSYSSDGRVSKKDILDTIQECARLKEIKLIDYKKNVMSNLTWSNEWVSADDKLSEYLFLIEK